MRSWAVAAAVAAGCGGLPDECSMQPDPGPCDAVFTRYYFDPGAQECLPFEWGGCGDYPFETIIECRATCE